MTMSNYGASESSTPIAPVTPQTLISVPDKIAEPVNDAVQKIAADATKVQEVANEVSTDPTLSPLIEKVAGTIPKKVRVWIHGASGVLGIAATVGGAITSYLTGDAALAVGGAVGIIGVVESLVSLSHLAN